MRMARTATDPAFRRSASLIAMGSKADLEAMSPPGSLSSQLTKTASQNYNNEFLDTFKGGTSKVWDKKDYTDIAKAFVTPQTSPEEIARLGKRFGPDGMDIIGRATEDKIMDNSLDPTTGKFVLGRYIKDISQYTPETLKTILGGGNVATEPP